MRRRSLRHAPPMVKAIRANDLTLELAYTLYRVNGDTSHDVACAVVYLDRMMEYLTCHVVASETTQIADSVAQHSKNHRSIAERRRQYAVGSGGDGCATQEAPGEDETQGT